MLQHQQAADHQQHDGGNLDDLLDLLFRDQFRAFCLRVLACAPGAVKLRESRRLLLT
jgi:hypothetical protein